MHSAALDKTVSAGHRLFIFSSCGEVMLK